LPVVQQWHIVLNENNEISWEVTFFAEAKIEIEEHKAAIMLPVVYKRWKTSKEEGKFPMAMSWNEAKLKYSDIQKIKMSKVKNNGYYLPEIEFTFSDNNQKLIPQIQNSDKQINARIISARAVFGQEGRKFLPGEYKWSIAKIKVEDENE